MLPAPVSLGGMIYAHIHNFPEDRSGQLDNFRALVVEYRYNMWGQSIEATDTLKNMPNKRKPLPCCGYIYNEETELKMVYFLKTGHNRRCYDVSPVS